MLALDRSNCSISLLLLAVQTREVEKDVYHVMGPPASCVNIALHHFADSCDFVVSGPNVGHNLGRYDEPTSGLC